MQIIREITMHIDRKQTPPIVDAVQNETVRAVSLALFEKSKAWAIPADATVMIRYSKPDATGGIYDSMPDGTRAWDIRENTVDIRIAPQALATAGMVSMQIAINTEGQELATFLFHLRVEPDPSLGTQASNDYINIGQWLMPRIYAFVSQAEAAASQALMSADRAATASDNAIQCVNMATTAANQAMHSATLAENAAQAAQEAAKNGVKTVNGLLPDETGNISLGETLPIYWQSHLANKIAAIQALQEAGGKDCFSFAVIADPHYESNLGKISPALAKRIMDACGIKYCLCLGDMQTRHGAKYDDAYIENEWKGIEEMLSPIRDRLLITQGNHDGSYGWFDLNGDGLINDDVNGDGVADTYDKDVHNFTPQKLYARIFRKVSTMEGVHFSEDGKGYYVDDTGSKVRYIILNSHVNKYELNEDGSVKYNNMYNFRFGQAQYDMVIEALTTVPSDSWSVIVASHVPLDRTAEYTAWGGEEDENGEQTGNPADCVVMMRLLNAYVNKTSYAGSFAGNQGGGAGYVNLADTTSADWWADSRLDSSGNQSTGATGRNVTNYIPYADGDILKIKGATLYASDRFAVYGADKVRQYLGTGSSLSEYITTDENGVLYLDTSKISKINAAATGGAFIRLPVELVDGAELIITTGDLNASTEGFDTVSVNADFTEANGALVSYHGGHVHEDITWDKDYAWNGAEHSDFPIIATRCDGAEENDSTLKAQRIAGTVTEQSFDVFTVNKATRKIYATKIGAGFDRELSY